MKEVGAVFAFVAFVASGCPGTVDPSLIPLTGGGGGGGGYGGSAAPCDPTPIFSKTLCTTCHDMLGTYADFDMVTAGWQTHLVGVNPKGDKGSLCPSNGPYLVPGVLPAKGLFIDKVNAGGMPACGSLMPQIGAKLTATEFACVQSWADALVMGSGAVDGGGR